MKALPTPFQKKTAWSALTFFSIVVIIALTCVAIWMTSYVLGFLQPVLVPLAVAGIIAYLLEPIIRKLIERGVAQSKATLLVFVGFMLALLTLASLVLVPAIREGGQLYEERHEIKDRVLERVDKTSAKLNKFLGASPGAEQYFSDSVERFSENSHTLGKRIGGWFWSRLSGVFGFLGYAIGLFLVPIYLYYFLKEGHHISENWSDYLPLRASQFKDEVVATLTEINGYLIAFFRGQMLVSMIDGLLIATALSFMGLPYAPVIGIFVALLGLIPYIGNLLVLIPALLIAIAHFGAEQKVVLDPLKHAGIEVGDRIEAPAAPRPPRRKKVQETTPDVSQPTASASAGASAQAANPQSTVPQEGVAAATVPAVPSVIADPSTLAAPPPAPPGKPVSGVVGDISADGKTAELLTNAWAWLPYPWAYPIIVLAIFLILQQVNGLVTAPKIVGESVGLHPLTVIFSVVFWALLLGGLLGALLAVPLTAAIKVLLRRYVWEARLKHETVGGAAALASGKD